MAWGGGGGIAFGNAQGTARANGLPFGGVPPELQDGVDRLLATEPDHLEPRVEFSHRESAAEARRLTLWRLLRAYPRLLWIAAGLIVVMSVTMQAGPYLTSIAIDDGMIPHHLSVVAWAALAYLACAIATALSQRSQVRTTGRLAAGVMNDLRVRVFTHLQRLSLDFFTDEKAGVLMSRMTSDIENLQQLLQDGLAQIAIQGLTMIVITVWLLVLDVKLALITLALVVPALTAASLWFRAESEKGYMRVRDGIANVLADLSESLHGVRIVTSHNRQRYNIVHHRNIVGEYRDAYMFTGRLSALYGPGTQMLSYLGQAGLLAIGGDMVLHHSLMLGELVAYFLWMNRFLQPIQLLVQQYNTFQQGRASVIKLRTLLETTPSVAESETAHELPPIEGRIVFEHVSFGYDPDVPVLRDVDLVIEPGETIAFVGPTGAGKSTMAKLITRFYDPTAGRILIDGHDLRQVTLASLRRQLGVVPQEPFLFAGTIRENLAFARPNASAAEVDEAVRTVGLEELIERMPQGLDTIVHERGQSLSSGERQLIALGRAFLAHPRVLVLDEATSNLDLLSETKVEAALDVLLEAHTAVLIAHRLSTAMKADRIVVVYDGVIVEVGSHDELVAAGGFYAAMYETWISQSESAGASA
jgi:ATP-binding cassette subfamily B protein